MMLVIVRKLALRKNPFYTIAYLFSTIK